MAGLLCDCWLDRINGGAAALLAGCAAVALRGCGFAYFLPFIPIAIHFSSNPNSATSRGGSWKRKDLG